MNNLKVYRWTGAFELACVVLWLSQFPLYMMGSHPSVYDGAAFGQHLFTIKNIAFTRILLDQGVFVTIIVFAAGFRHLIRKHEQTTSGPARWSSGPRWSGLL
ncbi:MAG: hypothetical protein WAV32_07925 [Halobacteriota archaeon]